MELLSGDRVSILRRIAQVDIELQQARIELNELRHNDPATGEVVLRGARLSREKTSLESRLGRLRLDPTQLTPDTTT